MMSSGRKGSMRTWFCWRITIPVINQKHRTRDRPLKVSGIEWYVYLTHVIPFFSKQRKCWHEHLETTVHFSNLLKLWIKYKSFYMISLFYKSVPHIITIFLACCTILQSSCWKFNSRFNAKPQNVTHWRKEREQLLGVIISLNSYI